MLNNLLKKIRRSMKLKRNTKDIGIDLGTANTVLYVKGENIVINEPTYVAVNNRNDNSIEFIGKKAKEIMGRTPGYMDVIRPLKNGVISDYEITEKMLSKFLDRIKKGELYNDRVIICVPSGVTQVERRAVVDAVKDAGAKEVYLIEEPVAAAIGAGIDMFEPKGHLIVDIGGGTTEIAFIVSGGAAKTHSIKIAGDQLNSDIIDYVRDNFNLNIGEKTAEDLKIIATNEKDLDVLYEIKGAEVVTGIPKEIRISVKEVNQSIDKSINQIIYEIDKVIEEITPEIAADIYETGIFLSGGGASIISLKEKIEEKFKLKVTVSNEPIYAVINGIANVFQEFNKYKNILISTHNDY
ncbi:rod shape-determining protein [Pseudostreptobacillus hongkongensis]|uniref:rod shape-determining protein n=1 Tax=Pseudostreptobacillus hongkongensis TaxID=1162717 RepID=UPI0028D8826E|nr:rod shape-determining protein [Pseudostreptobacillus hongkongensis]